MPAGITGSVSNFQIFVVEVAARPTLVLTSCSLTSKAAFAVEAKKRQEIAKAPVARFKEFISFSRDFKPTQLHTEQGLIYGENWMLQGESPLNLKNIASSNTSNGDVECDTISRGLQ